MKDLTARPDAGEERILALDVVRGFARFGVLAVNVLFFGGPLMAAGGDFR
jgi:uncharacterized membrane protein YeiB